MKSLNVLLCICLVFVLTVLTVTYAYDLDELEIPDEVGNDVYYPEDNGVYGYGESNSVGEEPIMVERRRYRRRCGTMGYRCLPNAPKGTIKHCCPWMKCKCLVLFFGSKNCKCMF